MDRKTLGMVCVLSSLAACQTSPRESPTVATGAVSEFETPRVAEIADAATRSGTAALTELQQAFQQVPNPEILGYVYPHLSGNLPVPGYYTVFPLRDGSHYAQAGEGHYPEVGP